MRRLFYIMMFLGGLIACKGPEKREQKTAEKAKSEFEKLPVIVDKDSVLERANTIYRIYTPGEGFYRLSYLGPINDQAFIRMPWQIINTNELSNDTSLRMVYDDYGSFLMKDYQIYYKKIRKEADSNRKLKQGFKLLIDTLKPQGKFYSLWILNTDTKDSWYYNKIYTYLDVYGANLGIEIQTDSGQWRIFDKAYRPMQCVTYNYNHYMILPPQHAALLFVYRGAGKYSHRLRFKLGNIISNSFTYYTDLPGDLKAPE